MSEIRANTVSDAAGTGPVTLTGQYAAKAWVNFNGTGTVAIRESGNVSSIIDIDTGTYGVSFSSSTADANYSVSGSVSWNTATWGNTFMLDAASVSASGFSFRSQNNDASATGYPLNDALIACAEVTR